MRGRAALFLLVALMALSTGCAGASQPDLIDQAAIEVDTAKVIRDDIKSQAQYYAAVKPAMTGIYFKESRLTLKDIQVQVGDMVTEGQILASLNTELIDDQLKAKRDEIDRLVRSGQHELDQLESDLSIAKLELANLGFQDYPDQEQIELKSIAVRKKELALTHAKENQASELNWQNKQLTNLMTQLGETVITAPWDGQITFVDQYVNPGGSITPYRPLVFISEPDQLFVEYTGIDSVMYFSSQEAYALINGKSYPLTQRNISAEELSNYKSSGGVPPLRFDFLEIDENVRGQRSSASGADWLVLLDFLQAGWALISEGTAARAFGAEAGIPFDELSAVDTGFFVCSHHKLLSFSACSEF